MKIGNKYLKRSRLVSFRAYLCRDWRIWIYYSSCTYQDSSWVLQNEK